MKEGGEGGEEEGATHQKKGVGEEFAAHRKIQGKKAKNQLQKRKNTFE